jgi:hypothetical protein
MSHRIGYTFECHVERAAGVKGHSDRGVARRLVSTVEVNVELDVGGFPKGGHDNLPD